LITLQKIYYYLRYPSTWVEHVLMLTSRSILTLEIVDKCLENSEWEYYGKHFFFFYIPHYNIVCLIYIHGRDDVNPYQFSDHSSFPKLINIILNRKSNNLEHTTAAVATTVIIIYTCDLRCNAAADEQLVWLTTFHRPPILLYYDIILYIARVFNDID